MAYEDPGLFLNVFMNKLKTSIKMYSDWTEIDSIFNDSHS